MTRARAWAGGALAAATLAAAACGSVDEPTPPSGQQQFAINQTNIVLDIGDSTVLTVVPVPVEPAVQGTVSWSSNHTDIVTVDTLVIIGEPARVRGRARGTATLTGIVRAPGQTITTSVTVRIAG